MGEGPNPNGKHSKYSIEDGKLFRKETVSYTHLTLPTNPRV